MDHIIAGLVPGYRRGWIAQGIRGEPSDPDGPAQTIAELGKLDVDCAMPRPPAPGRGLSQAATMIVIGTARDCEGRDPRIGQL